MEKKDQKTPEEVARDLETIDFMEIDEADLKTAFGGGAEIADCGTNTNCGCW
jgi:hypothetical protein